MSFRLRAVVAVVLVLLIAVTATSGFFFYRDNFITHYAMKVLSARAFRSGEIPWWNFNDIGGQPLAGNSNTLTFYPYNILYLFLPAHVAFNLHFILHLVAGFFAMRALCAARGADRNAALFAATVWATSGIAISSMCVYNIVTAVALVPLAFLGVERNAPHILGIAFGLMLLAAEPMTLLGSALAIAILVPKKMSLRGLAGAVAIAAAVGAPQLIAFAEIAGEVERVVPYRPAVVLGASLSPMRILEIAAGPLRGSLMTAGNPNDRLFSTIFLGLIVVPALVRRSRYVAIAAVLLFFALGDSNPILPPLVERFPSIRIMRYPEKLALPAEVAMVVLIAEYFGRAERRLAWALVTLVPLVAVAIWTIPIDWFAPYRVTPHAPVRERAYTAPRPPSWPARAVYRKRARDLEWLFGATAGLRYAVGRSPDGMHSVLSRIVAQRYAETSHDIQQRYLRIAGVDVPGHLPDAMIVPAAIGARGFLDAVNVIESPRFDEHRWAVAPAGMNGFVSAAGRVASYRENGQHVEIDLDTRGPALLFVNQTFFESWVARCGSADCTTMPLDIDRLGVLVPAGVTHVTLTFGRHHGAVIATWIASTLLMLMLIFRRKRAAAST
ncbi:MAG TPA: hypothetical protein VLU46_12010 [Thermoanaerobaculia bacterium]|nr:hypothetical protein [Thermoanaerobaculia bacterium]